MGDEGAGTTCWRAAPQSDSAAHSSSSAVAPNDAAVERRSATMPVATEPSPVSTTSTRSEPSRALAASRAASAASQKGPPECTDSTEATPFSASDPYAVENREASASAGAPTGTSTQLTPAASRNARERSQPSSQTTATDPSRTDDASNAIGPSANSGRWSARGRDRP